MTIVSQCDSYLIKTKTTEQEAILNEVSNGGFEDITWLSQCFTPFNYVAKNICKYISGVVKWFPPQGRKSLVDDVKNFSEARVRAEL